MSRGEARKRAGERGSALLIVFLLAAVIAITLYMELPVGAFEAQRQREELLVDRGNEYAHAIKLFYRKTGRYPASLKELEDTNRMRFLRHAFKDPLTGKEEWRLLHAGPGGVLTDSKVQKNTLQAQNGVGANGFGPNGTTGTPTGVASFPGSGTASNGASNPGFGTPTSPGSSSDSGSSSGDTTAVRSVVPRKPAISASGGGDAAAGANAAMDNGSDPSASLVPRVPGSAGSLPGNADAGTAGSTAAGGPGVSAPDAAGAASSGQPAAGNATDLRTAMATGVNGSTGFGNSGRTTGAGTLSSGGIAGVASKAKGHSIKTVQDQDDYSLWEFYYDPQKDAAKGITNALANMGQTNNGNNGTLSFPQNSSPPATGSAPAATSSDPNATPAPVPLGPPSTPTQPPQ